MMGGLYAELLPAAHVGVAAAPFAAAMLFRLVVGRGRTAGALLSLTTMWFLVNVLIAPYSIEMAQELHHILRH
jgi:hypothetical protein